MIDGYNIQCKCGHLGSMESFDTGIVGLWRCPECGLESGHLAMNRLTKSQKALWDACATSVDDLRASFSCARAGGNPVQPLDALAIIRRVDAGVITMGKTMRNLIESEGRKTFLDSVHGETVDLDLVVRIAAELEPVECLRLCTKANYATLRKASYRTGMAARPEIHRAVAEYGRCRFPLVKWN